MTHTTCPDTSRPTLTDLTDTLRVALTWAAIYLIAVARILWNTRRRTA